MPFVERKDGEIIGAYENAQPGRAEDFVAASDAAVSAFRENARSIMDNRAPRTNAEKLDRLYASVGLTMRDAKAEFDKIAKDAEAPR